MFKFNNSIVPNKVRIGWHFSSNKYACRDAYSALKSSVLFDWSPRQCCFGGFTDVLDASCSSVTTLALNG